MTLGVVLSGGGARGAYGAGLLSYVFGPFARTAGRVPQVAIVSGSSVGAVNGTLLASVADDPQHGITRLCDIWNELSLSDVMQFGFQQAARLPRVLFGGAAAAGIIDARPLAALIGREVPWRRLARNLRSGRLSALSVTATHLATGEPTIFIDQSRHHPRQIRLGPGIRVRYEHIGAHHVMASASIPLIFPPVPVHGGYYCDGGLRFNTPMAPALHLGAERLLIVGMATPLSTTAQVPALKLGRVPGAPFLIGKMLNAFLLDNVSADLDQLERINRVLLDGIAAYGPEFVTRTNEEATRRGDPPRRVVRTFAIRPSVDIGRLASDYLRTHRARFGRAWGRSFLRLLDVGEGADADLASYVLFDGEFARLLMDLARRDAAARKDELSDFLFSP